MRFAQLALILLITAIFTSCDRYQDVGDVGAGVLSGGILPLPEQYNSTCEWGLEKCKDKKEEPTKTTTPNSGTGSNGKGTGFYNRPPTVSFYIDSLEMNIGDQRHLLLNVNDPDDDNISRVDYFIQHPTMAILEVAQNPHIIKITAKQAGKTNLRAFAKDIYMSQGQTSLLPLVIKDPNATLHREILLTQNTVELEVNASKTIKYIQKGFEPNYTVVATVNNNLVEVSIDKALATVTIKSKDKAGSDEIQLTFEDGNGTPHMVRVPVTVKEAPKKEGSGGDGTTDPNGEGGGPLPPPDKGPKQTDRVVYNDPDACRNSYPWSTLKHGHHESRDRIISEKGSISFQSVTMVDEETLTLYYKEKNKILDTPYGISIQPPEIGLPIDAQRRDTQKQRFFILQANPSFLGDGFYYVKILGDCYRGVFPERDTPEDIERAKLNIKLVINTDD